LPILFLFFYFFFEKEKNYSILSKKRRFFEILQNASHMDNAASFDNLPHEVRLLRQKLDSMDEKLDSIASRNQSLNDSLIGVDEAAKFLGVTKGGIYSKVYRNLIPYYKSGGKLYFSKQEILQEIFSHRYPKTHQPSKNRPLYLAGTSGHTQALLNSDIRS
jgi:excisionase family DNA binding protein